MFHSNRTLEGLARPRFKLAIGIAPAPVLDEAAWRRAQTLTNAHRGLDSAASAYAAACRDLAEANRRMSRRSSAAAVFPIYQRKAWVAAAFRAINRARTRLRAARKALAALEAA